ncbi:hypothetical protein BB560_004440, partial [Smittium megazygosporum]
MSATTTISNINELPIEILVNIFSQLTPSELDEATLVCATWFRIINNDSCWKNSLKLKLGDVLPYRKLDLSRLNWFYVNNEIEEEHEFEFDKEFEKKVNISGNEGYDYPQQKKINSELVGKLASELQKNSKFSKKTNSVTSGKYGKKVTFPLYMEMEDKLKKRVLQSNSNWKLEYICRSELLKDWSVGYKLTKAESELGIGAIHKIYADFKREYVLSASLTHGVSAKTSLQFGDFGIYKDIRVDLNSASSPRSRNASNTDRNALPVYDGITRMQVVEFYKIKINEYFNKKTTFDESSSSKPFPERFEKYMDTQSKKKHERVVAVWGGYEFGHVFVQYFYKKNGNLEKTIRMDTNNRHASRVSAVKFVEQMKVPFINSTESENQSSKLPLGVNTVISGSSDGYIKLWNAESGDLLLNINYASYINEDATISCLGVIKKHILIAGTNSGRILIWDFENIENQRRSTNSEARERNLDLEPNNNFKVTSPNIVSFRSVRTQLSKLGVSNATYKMSVSKILVDEENSTFIASSVLFYMSDHQPRSRISDLNNASTANTTNNSTLESIGLLEKFSAKTGNSLEVYSWPRQKPLSSVYFDSSVSDDESQNERRVKLLVSGDACGNLHCWDFSQEFGLGNSTRVNQNSTFPNAD